MKKIWILFLCFSSLTIQAKDYYVTPADISKLKEILGNNTLRPGDEVILRDGIYTGLGEVDFSARGTNTDSIKLRAEHAGKAVISGALKMRVYGQYLQMEGLFFHKAWAKDLCMIEHMDDILTSGIDSLKIEGRMKTALYVATVARTYRKAIDDYFESPKLYRENMEWYKEQIMGCTYRLFTTGFFYGKPDETSQIYDSNTYAKDYTYLGFLEEKTEKGLYRITQRNKFLVGETIEVMRPDGENRLVTVKAIYDEEGNSCDSAPHPQQVLYLDLGEDLNVFDLLRRKESVS